ncbi:hypothetical protein F5879DRAFT_14017 [Lentinula edodes]|nr:hypothetical protein F5879DRAFT_14017 [Lentinula edodes]
MMLLRLFSSFPNRSCSLCLLFIGILLGTTSVIGSPIAGVSHLERRMIPFQVRTGYYRISKANGNEARGWVRDHRLGDIQCICVGIENANCFGLIKEGRADVLHVTHLKMRKSQSSAPNQQQPDAVYFTVEKDFSVNWNALGNWKREGFNGTVWDFLQNIANVNDAIKEKWGYTLLVYDQDSFIEFIKAYLKMEGIIQYIVRPTSILL